LVQIAQECEKLTVDEAKSLISHLKALVDAEELAARPPYGWRKREIGERIERKEYLND
jgi:hypothetical protein